MSCIGTELAEELIGPSVARVAGGTCLELARAMPIEELWPGCVDALTGNVVCGLF